MGADWSLDLLERELAAGFALLDGVERSGGLANGESQALAEGVLRCMNGALQKVSESLEAQAKLGRELARTREEFRKVQQEQDGRIDRLESELAQMRQARRDEMRRTAQVRHAEAAACRQEPKAEHLSRPLVLRSQQGDYFGVTDRHGQALSLGGFLRLVEGRARCAPQSGRTVASVWEPRAELWSLTVSILGPRERTCYALDTRPLRTPSGNEVTLLERMLVDDRPVPNDYVVRMFRQLRDAFQED